MAGRQLIEQLALHMGAGEAVQFLFDLPLEQFGELIDSFQAHGFGHFVVSLGFLRFLHFADDNIKSGVLALQVLDIIVVGERDLDKHFVIGLLANQLVLEARDQTARAQFDRHALALAAFKRHAVNLAFKVDQALVADLCLVGLRCGCKLLLAFCKFLQRLVDGFLVGLDLQAFQFQAIDIGGGDIRQNFQVQLDERILARLVALIQIDIRLHRRTQLVVRHGLFNAFLDCAAQRVLHQGVIVHLAH